MSIIRWLFLWFYRLSIPKAVLTVLLATVCFLWLEKRYRTYGLWKMIKWGCTLIWLGIIFAMTIQERTVEPSPSVLIIMPFHSYMAVLHGETTEILRSNFMNVVLFYPFGLLLGSCLPQRWTLWRRLLLLALLGIVISTTFEFCQHYYFLGVAEVDDVIHNT